MGVEQVEFAEGHGESQREEAVAWVVAAGIDGDEDGGITVAVDGGEGGGGGVAGGFFLLQTLQLVDEVDVGVVGDGVDGAVEHE